MPLWLELPGRGIPLWLCDAPLGRGMPLWLALPGRGMPLWLALAFAVGLALPRRSRSTGAVGWSCTIGMRSVRFTLYCAYAPDGVLRGEDRKSTRLNSSHVEISYAVFCLKKKKIKIVRQ